MKMTTPLTQTNRRRAKGSNWSNSSQQPNLSRNCERCGQPVSDAGKLCKGCRAAFQDKSEWLTAGRSRLAKLREEGEDPAHGGQAGYRRAAKVSAENRKSADWSRDNSDRPSAEVFKSQILPGLQSLSSKEMRNATGLSLDYCSKIKRGIKTPHPRHWVAFADLITVEPAVKPFSGRDS